MQALALFFQILVTRTLDIDVDSAQIRSLTWRVTPGGGEVLCIASLLDWVSREDLTSPLRRPLL